MQEIQFFVEYLQQQQRQRQGSSGVAVSTLAEENSRAILDYVARTKGANVCLFCLFVCLLLICLFVCLFVVDMFVCLFVCLLLICLC